jgi:hypothetical protein
MNNKEGFCSFPLHLTRAFLFDKIILTDIFEFFGFFKKFCNLLTLFGVLYSEGASRWRFFTLLSFGAIFKIHKQ